MGLCVEFSLELDAGGERRSLAFAQGRVIIGRGRGCDVHIPETSISLQHLALEHIGGHWTATDLDSTNGSWFLGSRLIPGRPLRIDQDGQLQVGTQLLSIRLEPVAQGASNAQTQTLARALLRAELASEGSPCEGPSVLVLSDIGKGQRKTLSSGDRILVGRGDTCDLCIADAELSREHLEVRFDGYVVEVFDRKTKNGSQLGGRPFEQSVVSGGDHIHIGATTLLIEDPIDDLLAERVQLPDEKIPLARASRVPQRPGNGNPRAGSSTDALQRDSKGAGNRRIQEPPHSLGVGGAERLLFTFALVLLLASLAGLWLLFR